MNKTLTLIVACGASLLGGCTLAPKYSRPDAPVPADWPAGAAYEEQGATDEPTPAEVGWRDFLPDPKLRKVIETALVNNRDLRVAALNVRKARALYGVQRAGLFPTINAVGSGSEHRASSDFTAPGARRTGKQYSVDLGAVAWEIDFFGRIRSLADEALEDYLATEQAHHSARLLLVSSVARAYLTLAADREALALSRRTLATQKEAYELARRRYDLGVATELDLRRAQAPVEAARGDIARYSQSAARAANALRLLVGSPIPDDLLPAKLDGVEPPAQVSAGLSSEVLLARPDIVAAEHRLKGSYARIGAARAAFFPRISLTSTIGAASLQLSNLFAGGMGTWTYGPQIVMPIFDARTWSAHRASKVEREIAVAEYERAIQAAFREVADALAVCGTVDERVAAQEALVKALSDTHRLSLARFDKGIDSYLGVLDAQRSLFDAQQGLISLRLLQLASRIRLYAVLGGGWQAKEDEEPSTAIVS